MTPAQHMAILTSINELTAEISKLVSHVQLGLLRPSITINRDLNLGKEINMSDPKVEFNIGGTLYDLPKNVITTINQTIEPYNSTGREAPGEDKALKDKVELLDREVTGLRLENDGLVVKVNELTAEKEELASSVKATADALPEKPQPGGNGSGGDDSPEPTPAARYT